jgi:hypothetical protein
MYETDIFVKFKFRFIGMPIFITKDNLSHTKRTQTYTRSIEMNFLTLSDVKHATSVNSFTYFKTVLTICALFSKFLLVRIPDTHRAQTGLIINSWGKFLLT